MIYSLSSVVSPLLAGSPWVGGPGAERHCRYLQGNSRQPKQRTKTGEERCGPCLASELLPLGRRIVLLKFHHPRCRAKTEPQIKEPFLWPANSSFRNSYLRNNPRETRSQKHRDVHRHIVCHGEERTVVKRPHRRRTVKWIVYTLYLHTSKDSEQAHPSPLPSVLLLPGMPRLLCVHPFALWNRREMFLNLSPFLMAFS